MPVALLALGWLYAAGVRTLWRSAGRGRGVRRWQVGAFACALVALAIALLPPVDALAETSFAAHMVQHLLLMTVAAPLLALAAPEVAILWSLSHRERVAAGRVLHSARALRHLMSLPVAFALHSVALWAWHAPALYESAMHHGVLHVAEHAIVFGTGWLFWTAAFGRLRSVRRPHAAAILYVFALGAQCTGLGALLTLSPRPWYPSYPSLDDQVLAGVLMWVPAGMVYLGYALFLLGSWLRPLEPAFRPAAAGRPRQQSAQHPGAPG